MPSHSYDHLDSDAYRLPEGMQRIGYDADTQKYTFRDETDGSLWESEAGSKFGRLWPVGSKRGEGEGLQGGEEGESEWRYMAPFFVIVVVVMLMLFWFVGWR